MSNEPSPVTLRELTQERFSKVYLQTTEADWEVTSIEKLEECDREVRRRGLRENLLDQIGEMMLPHERWLTQRYAEDNDSTRSPSTTSTSESERPTTVRLASGQEMTLEEAKAAWDNAKRQLLPVAKLLGLVPRERTQADFVLIPGTENPLSEASTESGATLNASEIVPGVGPDNSTGQQSSEASSGAPTSAAVGYGIVAYQRLPLQGKRDAFAPGDGFLYVRNDTLKDWFGRMTAGRCCPLQRKGQPGHSSDCWLRDAVR